MGSKSDYATMKFCEKVLKILKISFEKKIISAHRTPDRMYKFAKTAEKNVIKSSAKTSTPKIDIPSSILVFSSGHWIYGQSLQRAGRRSPLIATRKNFRS